MTNTELLFRAIPYAAVGTLFAGLALRAALSVGAMPAVRRSAAEASDSLLGGSLARAWVVALVGLHVVAVAWPRGVLRFGTAPWRLVLLEVIGLALALGTLAITVRATSRLLKRPAGSAWADVADAAFLALVLVALASGVVMAVLHRWVSAWAAATIAPWARSLLTGNPDTALVANLPLPARIHLVASFAAIAFFPLTRLGALPVLAVARLAALADRPLLRAATAARSAIGRIGIHARLWPEPEIRWLGPAPGDARRRGDAPSRRHPSEAPGKPRFVRTFGPRT